ncbi:MAG: DUF1569 domain-containing protein, partial [Terriglobales bacterium]
MDSCLERVEAEILRATSGMSPEQMAWHPEGKWSAAQVLEHLTLAFSGTAKGMERALTGEITCPPRTMRNRFNALVVVSLGYMPEGRQAPKGTVPGEGDPQNAVSKIIANLAAMDAAIAKVEAAKGASVRLRHPILGPLTLPQWRKFHWVHTA